MLLNEYLTRYCKLLVGGLVRMDYDGRPRGYFGRVIEGLRNFEYSLKDLYRSSVARAEREQTGLGVALVRNLGDVYNNGLDSLLIPVLVYDGASESQHRPLTEFFMGDKAHGAQKSPKDRREELRRKHAERNAGKIARRNRSRRNGSHPS